MSAGHTTPREQFIECQRRWLAPYATGEWAAGGRRHDEVPHPYRTCFQRDRDRIIHCSAFRRLDYKTQVFIPHMQDHLRTRLTHTLEVAQISRNLARAMRLNEDLAETAALAHDLGHPPFGHAGEAVLDELMADHGNFEHNRQSLRIVDYLEHPYPAFRGLNLSRAVRASLAKHTTRYDSPAGGEFDADPQGPIEGQLVDICDEIAYTSADVDDALQAGWITPGQLADLPLWRQAWARADQLAPDAREIHKQIRAVKSLLAILADDAIATTETNLAATALASPDDVRQAPAKCVAFSESLQPALVQLQDFLLANVYTNEDARPHDHAGRRRITELFELFAARPDTLPERYRRRIDGDSPHRVVCDYIAGMTDRYCTAEHKRLCV